jgi:spermidine/putrescine transport system permease protein
MRRLGFDGWTAIKLVTAAVYAFMFGPIVIVVLLSFNRSEFGGFPMTGLTLDWFRELAGDEQVIAAVKTSLKLGTLATVISTVIGTAAAFAVVRYRFRGRSLVTVLLTAPILVPPVVLGVALLLFLRSLGMTTSFALLLLGHVVVTLPFVFLVVQARLVSLPRVYEEAAMSLGANRWRSIRDITLPLLMPAVVAGMLFAFTISFDEVTATLFWRPVGTETVPTQILAMLRLSMSQELNALGTAMIAFTVALPMVGMILIYIVGRGRVQRLGAARPAGAER